MQSSQEACDAAAVITFCSLTDPLLLLQWAESLGEAENWGAMMDVVPTMSEML